MAVLGKNLRKEFGGFLAEKRIKANVTQIQAARSAGLTSAQSISNVERGLAPPPMKLLKMLVKLYGIDVRELESLMVDQYQRALRAELSRPGPTPRKLQAAASSSRAFSPRRTLRKR